MAWINGVADSAYAKELTVFGRGGKPLQKLVHEFVVVNNYVIEVQSLRWPVIFFINSYALSAISLIIKR